MTPLSPSPPLPRSHATGGSMVRPRKLGRPVQCAQAVVDRYGVILDTESTVDRQELDALQQDINARFVQVGKAD